MSLKIIFTEFFFFKIKNKNTTNVNSLQGLCITGLIVSNYIYIYIYRIRGYLFFALFAIVVNQRKKESA